MTERKMLVNYRILTCWVGDGAQAKHIHWSNRLPSPRCGDEQHFWAVFSLLQLTTNWQYFLTFVFLICNKDISNSLKQDFPAVCFQMCHQIACYLQRMHSHIACICLIFPHCVEILTISKMGKLFEKGIFLENGSKLREDTHGLPRALQSSPSLCSEYYSIKYRLSHFPSLFLFKQSVWNLLQIEASVDVQCFPCFSNRFYLFQHFHWSNNLFHQRDSIFINYKSSRRSATLTLTVRSRYV